MSEDLTNKLPRTDSDKLNEILTRVNGLDSRLAHVEETMEQRLHDTRPIWQKVLADITHLQEGQSVIRERLIEMNSTIRDVNRDQIVINDVMRRIQMDLHTMDGRLYNIELNRCQRNSST